MLPMPEVDQNAWGEAVSDDLATVGMSTIPPLRTFEYEFKFEGSDRGVVVAVTLRLDGEQVEGDIVVYQAIYTALGPIQSILLELWVELPGDRRKNVLEEAKSASFSLRCAVNARIAADRFSPKFAELLSPKPTNEVGPTPPTRQSDEPDEDTIARAQAANAADPYYRDGPGDR